MNPKSAFLFAKSFVRTRARLAAAFAFLFAASSCAPPSPETVLTGGPWRVESARLEFLPADAGFARSSAQKSWRGRIYEFQADGAYRGVFGAETREGRWELRDSSLKLFYHEQAAHEWRLLSVSPDSVVVRQTKGLALRIVLLPQK